MDTKELERYLTTARNRNLSIRDEIRKVQADTRLIHERASIPPPREEEPVKVPARQVSNVPPPSPPAEPYQWPQSLMGRVITPTPRVPAPVPVVSVPPVSVVPVVAPVPSLAVPSPSVTTSPPISRPPSTTPPPTPPP
eukprot:RCo032335